MDRSEIIEKIMQKKEFSQLPKKDVLMVFEKFDKSCYTDEEKIKLTRDSLRKIFSVFGSQKLLNLRDKPVEWFLKKHISTKERFEHYPKVYKRILKSFPKKFSVIDLGAGINGLSYSYFKKLGYDVDYLAVEAIGQFVDSMNWYFEKERIKGKAVHLSLFDSPKIKSLVEKSKTPKIIFLFKVLDSLEMIERDYSKKLLLELKNKNTFFVVSFAMRSLVKRQKFSVSRKWFFDFVKMNFEILDDFQLGTERYILFKG